MLISECVFVTVHTPSIFGVAEADDGAIYGTEVIHGADAGDFASDEEDFFSFTPNCGDGTLTPFDGFKAIEYEVPLIVIAFGIGDVLGADFEGFDSADDVLGNLHG